MKISVSAIGLILVGLAGWFIGSQLSPDAIGMAVGILFGIMAAIPMGIMVLASRRQADKFYGQQNHQQNQQSLQDINNSYQVLPQTELDKIRREARAEECKRLAQDAEKMYEQMLSRARRQVQTEGSFLGTSQPQQIPDAYHVVPHNSDEY